MQVDPWPSAPAKYRKKLLRFVSQPLRPHLSLWSSLGDSISLRIVIDNNPNLSQSISFSTLLVSYQSRASVMQASACLYLPD